MNNSPLARKSDLVIQESGDELLIYDLKTNKAFCLNETSALVWQLSDGTNSIKDIALRMTEKMKAPISGDFVLIATEQLNRDGLLDGSAAFADPFEDVSRREMIRKVGFASVVALPIVSSTIAPSATNSQSLLANLASCTSDTQCNSNNCFITRCCTAGVNNSVPLTTCFCAAPGNCAPFAAVTCCATGTATQEPTFPAGFCGAGAVLCSCDSEPRCF